MQSREIRQKFFDFFESKKHEIVASAPMVVKDDPTLMFTNAGMNQFKDLFLGNSEVKHSRIANSQKCLRVSGKHNDLEEVGVDTYHHTMFEMLGNWSFGDYFKKESIAWAWELLTEVYKIDKERLYITIFGGDEQDGLAEDSESRDLWKEWIHEDRILACSKKDNFWEMGDTGPCGPCSEIHVDLRPADEIALVPGKELVNADHPQVIEIWNLVFMEFNRMSDGSLVPLPNKHIDTGMGFERLVRVLQHKSSNYDTDVFSNLIQSIESQSGIEYTRGDSKTDIAMRVISDHIRAVSFSIADGQLPSNNGAGYVIRRILRRAVRYGYSFLDLNSPFMCDLVKVLVADMGDFFPELKAQRTLIERVIKEEEEGFLRTLEKGIKRLDEIVKSTSGDILEGKPVFELYDTYGFPVDLTSLIAAEYGKTIDQEGFNKELNAQKERSRAAGKIETGDWVVLVEDDEEEFIGYDHRKAEVKITRYRKVKAKGKDMFQVVLNITPFYAESGGQVGDTGVLVNGADTVRIVNTVKENNLIIHLVEELPDDPSKMFEASVNTERRDMTASNHSATHLLHEALRQVLGEHVEQKGSLVHPDYLRFDFSHFQKVSDDELRQIEDICNSRIRENLQLEESRNTPINEAREMGATMLFGEKYGDLVRVIKFGSSIELCGGTHVPSTSAIGMIKIMSEGAVAAGIRRIEAITGKRADEFVAGELQLLKDLRRLLKNPKDISGAIRDLQDKNASLESEITKLNKDKAQGMKGDILSSAEEVNGILFIAQTIDLGASEIKDLAFQLKGAHPNLFAVFGSENDGKALLTVAVGDDAIAKKSLNAGTIIRELAKEIKGGGGGQPFFATAGGKDIQGLERAIKSAKSFIS
ncbi:MAG: alanine--tRNA ligase [Flavobacteriales bacterium]|nr:alanine--tRNA ligase [Flavobacteriales bacterium]